MGRSILLALTLAFIVIGRDGPARLARAAVTVERHLVAVSCVSPRSCTAVGERDSWSGQQLARSRLSERWNGSRWVMQSMPNPTGASSTPLRSVSCVTATSCVAVGDADSNALAEHWNGTRWSVLSVAALPVDLGSISLNAVSCISTTWCMAVGGYSSGCAYASYCPSGNYYQAGPAMELWNGTAWTLSRLPAGAVPESLDGVSCTSRMACVAVGQYGFGPTRSIAARWNGKRWQQLAVLGTVQNTVTNALVSVSCTSARMCIAVGTALHWRSGKAHDILLAERWDGSLWTVISRPTTVFTRPEGGSAGLTVPATGVACTSPASCMAIGGPDRAARWNGTRWTILPPIVPTLGISPGISCPSATSCIAVGNGTSQWNGTRWSALPTP